MGGWVCMKNSLRVLLAMGIMMCVIPVAISAVPLTDADVSIDFIINDGNSADSHDENGWLVAGNGITSRIRVTCTKTPDVINFVEFTSVEKDVYGDVTTGRVTTSPYETTFCASQNKAGLAPIQVHINYTADDTGYDYYRKVYQPIDHNTPMAIRTIIFDSEVTLNEVVDIRMVLEDAYGNTVTDCYEDVAGGTPEAVTFSTTPYAGSGFYDDGGYNADSVCVPVSADGSVVASFKTGTEAGPKYLLHIVPDAALDDTWLTVTARADGEPYDIMVSVDPNTDTPPYVPADGETKFYLTYYLIDQYGNPSGNQTVHFNDSVIGDEFTQRTNSDGQIRFTFGPFDSVGTYNIRAEAIENTSVMIDQALRFTNTSPQDMVLTANPQSMPSAEVADEFTASIRAKVIDESGNGVPGEEVQFSIISPGSWDDAHVSDPYLDETIGVTEATATTNVDGVANMNFTPGEFIRNPGNEQYNETASESCLVQATWSAVSRNLELEWKNYPYLRVETEVEPETVAVGDPVEVTVRLIGDGWALYPDPIDVMLCVDRSGSMLRDYPDRMVSLMDALKIFNGEMTDGRDRVGLASFGQNGWAKISDYSYRYWAGYDSYHSYYSTEDNTYVKAHYPGNGKYYDGSATLDLPLAADRSEVNETIEGLVPMGGTPMRYGLYMAITEIINNRSADAVMAVILLSDGDYNTGGDPLARSTEYYCEFSGLSSEEQNMSVYAANHNITLYSISFRDGISGDGVDALRTLAEGSGGSYYHAPNASQLGGIYTEIAGELKTEAGVDTSMDVVFTDVELNNVSRTNDPDDPILEYEFEDGVSTLVKSWNTTGSPPGTEDVPNVMGPLTLDQWDDWSANQSLNFATSEIGTIHLGQTWQAAFLLNVSKAGNINIFGEDSSIIFNNGEDSLSLPKTYVTAVDNLNATGINFTGLEVYGLTCSEKEDGGVIENYLTMDWNLNYSGTYTAIQDLYYQNVDNGIWTKFCEVSVTGPVSDLAQTRQLYVADFPPGTYKLRVHGRAEDTPDSVIETPYEIEIGTGGHNYIRLE